MTKKRKCCYYGCKNESVGSYSVDLDISGMPFCEKHKEDVHSSLMWAVLGIMELSDAALGIKPAKKKKNKSS